MDKTDYIPVFNWMIPELTVAERMKTLQGFWQHIEPYIKPGGRALDLACGSGAAAFMLAEAGMQVTAVDSSPLLIEQGKEENAKRKADVEFIRADVLGCKYDEGAYDLALVLGNPLLDFPPERFAGFRDNVASALKPGAHVIFEYFDNVANCSKWIERGDHSTPEGFAMNFKGYDANLGAYTWELHNPELDERCTYHGYVYTIPLLRQLLAPRFELAASHRLAAWKFLDLWVRE